MYDYRRNQQDSHDSTYYKLKNVTFIGIVGIAGFHSIHKLNAGIHDYEKRLKSKIHPLSDPREAIVPLFQNNDILENELSIIDTKSDHLSSLEVNEIDTDYHIWEEHVDIEDLSDDFVEIQQKVLPDEVKELAENMSGSSHVRRQFEAEYRGITAIIADNDLEIININQSFTQSDLSNNYSVKVKNINTGKVETIKFPKHRSGVIQHKGSNYIYKPSVHLGRKGDKVVFLTFDNIMLTGVENRMKNISSGLVSDKATRLKWAVDSEFSKLRSEQMEILQGNDIIGRSGMKFTKFDVISLVNDGLHKVENKDLFHRLNQTYEGLPLYGLTKDGRSIDTGYKISIPGSSEQMHQKGGGATEPIVGQSVLPEYIKQSTGRMNYLKGHYVEKGREYWSSKFGFIDKTSLDKFAGKRAQSLPGKVANLGFYHDGGSKIADGSMIHVIQEINGMPNTLDFTGASVKNETVMFEKKGTKTAFNKTEELRQNYLREREKGGVVRVTKGEIIGLDPVNNKPIISKISGIITGIEVEENNQRITFQITADKYLGITSKETSTKAVVDHVTLNGNIKNHFLTPDQKIAEYISRYDGKMGLDFLINLSSKKRYDGGMYGLGFINKVINDVVQLKKDEYIRKGKLVVNNSQGRDQFVKEMKNMVKSLLEVQLGTDVVSEIENIHIGPDFDVGVEMKKGITMTDPLFHKVIDIETSMKLAEQTGNWTHFIKRMDEIEKKIQKISGLSNYRVVAYAKQIYKYTKQNSANMAAFIMSGTSQDHGTLIFSQIRPFMSMHMSGDTSLHRIASHKMTSGGFINGSKLTSELQRNYASMGLKNLVRYADFLKDHHMGYILNKYKNPETFIMDDLRMKDNTIQVGGRKFKAKTMELNDDLLTRLAEEDFNAEVKAVNKTFRIAKDSIDNISGMVKDDDAYNNLFKDVLTADELIKTGKLGIARNSLGLVEAELFEELKSLINVHGSKEAMYLKLPFEVTVNGVKGDMINLVNFDKEDSMELLALTDENKTPGGTAYKQRMYTQNAYGFEQLSFMHKVAKIQTELRDTKVKDRRRRELQMELESASQHFYNRLNQLSASKSSSFTRALNNTKLPLSGQFEMMAAFDIGMSDAAMTPNAATRYFSGGKISNYDELNKRVNRLEKLKKIGATNIDDIIKSEDALKNHIRDMRNILRTSKSGRSFIKEISSEDYYGAISNDTIASFNSMKTTADDLHSKYIKNRNFNGSLQEMQREVTELHKRFVANLNPIVRDIDTDNFIYYSTYKTIKDIESGNLNLLAEGQRAPYYNPHSVHSFNLKIINPRKILKDVLSKYGKESTMYQNTARLIDERVFVSPDTAAAYAADFDKDFMNLVVTSLDKIKENENQLIRDLQLGQDHIHKLHNDDLFKLIHGSDAIKGTSMDSFLAYLKRHVVIEDKTAPNKYRAANSSASMVLRVLDEAKNIDKIESDGLMDFISKHIEKALPNANKKEQTRAKWTLYNTIMGDAESLFGEKTFTIKVMTGIKQKDKEQIAKERLAEKGHIVKSNPEDLTAMKKLTEDQIKQHDDIVLSKKEDFIAYQRRIQEATLKRFGEMKVDTPIAYKAGAALSHIAESIAYSDSQKEFLYLLGGQTLAQNTISTKHGTPSYLDDLVSTIKTIGSDSAVSSTHIDKLTNANLNLKLTEGIKSEIFKFGLIEDRGDPVTWDVYDNYLKERGRLFEELYQIHNDAQQELLDNQLAGINDQNILEENYRAKVTQGLKSFKVNDIAPFESEVDQWMYKRNLVTHALVSNNDAIKANAKHRENLKNYTKEQWKELSRLLKTYKDSGSAAVFNDPYIQASTAFSSDYIPATNNDLITDTLSDISERSKFASQDIIIEPLNIHHRNVLRVTKHLHPDRQIKTPVRGNKMRSMHKSAYENLEKQERRAITSKIKERVKRGNTLFKKGSVLEMASLAGTEKSMLSALKRGAGKNQGKAIAIGILAGAFAAQSVSQLLTGDPVPGLKQTSGLGGEYYDNSGIMGREMEFMLKPKPVKVIPYYEENNSAYRDIMNMQNINDASISYNRPDIQNSFKGVTVR